MTQVVKGGLVASVNGLRGFIPASQMELHFVKDLSIYVDQTVEALPIEIDIRKQRLVLSRRKILEEERARKQEEIFSTLEAGQTVRGTVKRLVDYGAFIDIGGVDGLAHISDLSWQRVKQPSDVLEVGQELDVYVKNVDPEAKRISLSVKDTMRDPWLDRAEQYSEGDYIEGKVIKLTDFGAFMEIEPGFDGLIPMGELCERRIEGADEAGEEYEGEVVGIKDFGAFVKLTPAKDGLLHISRVANGRVGKVEDVLTLGDIVKVKVLRIDMKRKRISLSIVRAKKDADTAIFKRYQAEQQEAEETGSNAESNAEPEAPAADEN